MSMARVELHVEELLSRRVYGVDGGAVGRLEEIRVETRRDGTFVTEYLVGAFAMLERLAAWSIGRSVLRVLHRRRAGYRVPWDKLELSDPRRPTLRCPVPELKPIDER